MTELLSATAFTTDIGPVTVVRSARGIRRLVLEHIAWDTDWQPSPMPDVEEQLNAYLRGERKRFDLPLDAQGTAFDHAVWDALCALPYGQTTTYGALAAQLGKPRAAQAVGSANGRNPIAIVVPCHRVIGRDGSLTGYAWGLATKRRLLTLEGALNETLPLFG